MEQRKIICISREYGSGGRIIGEGLARQLGIPCYDKMLLEKTASEHGIPEKLIESVDEKPVSWYSLGFPIGIRNPYVSDYDALYYIMNDRIFGLQSQTIRSVAAEGSCVIIGRVAEEVLKDDPDMVSVFIHADRDDRIKRIAEIEKTDLKKAAQMVRKTDRNRANYHNYYSERKWGRCSSYDLAISTSKFGIEGTIKAIISTLDLK